MRNKFIKQLQMLSRRRPALAIALLALAGAGVYGFLQFSATQPKHSEVSSQSRKGGQQRYKPSPAEWASLTIQPVTDAGLPGRARHRRQDRDR